MVSPDLVPALVPLPSFSDHRGRLSVAEVGAALPFQPARYFVVDGVPAGASRAGHAQREGHELLSCVAGSCAAEVVWRAGRETHRLDDPAVALYLPPLVWVECRDFSAGAILLVACSHPYDPADQVADFDEFRAMLGR